MLSVNSYPHEYVEECRAKIARQTSAYEKLSAGASGTPAESALAEFEPLFFNHMVLALDHYFLHRARGMEGKDGNPLNEVRVLCDSLMENDGKLAANKTIKPDPAKSLLQYGAGDEIAIDEASFNLLSKAFLEEIESKYP